MFEVGQHVLVIPEKGLPYNATIVARALGDNGPGAYKVSQHVHCGDSLCQWHKASEVFILEKTTEDTDDGEAALEVFLAGQTDDTAKEPA